MSKRDSRGEGKKRKEKRARDLDDAVAEVGRQHDLSGVLSAGRFMLMDEDGSVKRHEKLVQSMVGVRPERKKSKQVDKNDGTKSELYKQVTKERKGMFLQIWPDPSKQQDGAGGNNGMGPSGGVGHSRDEYIGVVNPQQIEALHALSKTQEVQQCLRILTRKVVDGYDIKSKVKSRLPKKSGSTDHASAKFKMPSIMNTRESQREQAQLATDILKYLVIYGFAIVAVDLNLIKHSLGDLKKTMKDQLDDWKPARRARREQKPLLPIRIMDPAQFTIHTYMCHKTGKMEYRPEPLTEWGQRIWTERDYRFEVYTGQNPAFYQCRPGYDVAVGPKDGLVNMNSLLSPLVKAYWQLSIQERAFASVTTINSRPIFVARDTLDISELFPIDKTDPTKTREDIQKKAQQAGAAIRDANVALQYGTGGANCRPRLGVNSSTGYVADFTVPAIVDRLQQKRREHEASQYGRTTSSNSHGYIQQPSLRRRTREELVPVEDSRGKQQLLVLRAESETTLNDVVTAYSKTPQDVNIRTLEQGEFAAATVPLNMEEFVEDFRADLPAGWELTFSQMPTYTGGDILVHRAAWASLVFSTFNISALQYGQSGGRTSAVGSSGAKGQEAAVQFEVSQFDEFCNSCRSELAESISVLHDEWIDPLSRFTLEQIFDKEYLAADMTHDQILEAIKAYEDAITHIAYHAKTFHPYSKRSSVPQTQQRKTSDDHQLSMAKLYSLAQQVLPMSFDLYFRIVDYLTHLALLINTETYLEVTFEPKEGTKSLYEQTVEQTHDMTAAEEEAKAEAQVKFPKPAPKGGSKK